MNKIQRKIKYNFIVIILFFSTVTFITFINYRSGYGIGITNDKVADVVNEVSVVYQDNESIIIDNGKEKKIICSDRPSKPYTSLDKKQIAYISPFEWEELGQLFIYDVEKDKDRIAIRHEDIQSQDTPKIISWLDNRYMLVIIGFGYGTISVGGDVYVLDTLSNKLSLYIKSENYQEIKDIKVDGQTIYLDIARFNSDMTKYIIEQRVLKYEEVMDAAKRIS